ncbi:MAG: restriction endonuclease subunit S [Oceanospirillaceae bacterium]|nr:restriction endonuclease subunit S [Oceanospirillaceae bacterium]MBT13271.1 restriction endonuclease subunit S [Oceanospirillaceae bacterium]|tara:strand:+ start:4653 stop:6053 length:1401 start_codon:yes stop_codon:yes gene_type:complete
MVSEWQQAFLTDLYEIGSGLSKPAEDFGSGYPFLAFKDVFNNVFVPAELEQLVQSNEKEQQKCSVLRGDVFLTRTSETMNELGMSSVALKDYPQATFNGFTKRLRPKEGNSLVPEYVAYYLRSPAFRTKMLAFSTMSTRASLNNEMIGRLTIDFPNPEVQFRIAAVLKAFDDKIALNCQINTTLESMAQALFKSWFVDFDPVIDNALAAGHEIPDALQKRAQARAARHEALCQQINKTTETTDAASAEQPLPNGLLPTEIQQLFPDRFVFTEEMGWVPEGWEAIKFSDLVEAKQGKYLAKDEMKELPEGDFIYPVWGGNGILGYSLKKAYEEPVTLMTCRGSNCGLIKTTQSPSWVSNNSFACSSKYGSQYFLYLYFLSEDFSECVSGSAQPQITYTALKNKLMKYPVSKSVCDAFSQIVAVFREKQFDNDRQMELLCQLRDSLLPKLLSGQLTIPAAEQAIDEVN